MKPRALLHILILAFSLTIFDIHAKLFIHQMQYLKAEQVIPAIKPHLAKETTLSAKDYQLFIDSTEAEYKKIQSMLKMLDKKPKNLMIEVRVLDRRLDDWEMKGAQLKVSGNSSSAKITRYQTNGHSKIDSVYRLKTMEGYQGFVTTGEAFPTHNLVKHYDSFVPQTKYKNAKSGFYVTANQLPSQQFRVAINAQQQKRGNGNVIKQSQTANQFTVNEGHWVLIASTGESSSNRSSNKYRVASSNNTKRWFYLRVLAQKN
ncbi:MAG: hypothetical protein OQJ89_06500 [Kangiellaceae bacterium]|nr:hypothetical protein [Kangiellaceae bacterium]MCW8997862.1 hypothetical protein [Kangiellaceae bacterium]MCW9016593.1 hypothetical protein [Kangiellaceae bacterium]